MTFSEISAFIENKINQLRFTPLKQAIVLRKSLESVPVQKGELSHNFESRLPGMYYGAEKWESFNIELQDMLLGDWVFCRYQVKNGIWMYVEEKSVV